MVPDPAIPKNVQILFDSYCFSNIMFDGYTRFASINFMILYDIVSQTYIGDTLESCRSRHDINDHTLTPI
jgi:hypothetical protein